jgi:cell division protein FtsB
MSDIERLSVAVALLSAQVAQMLAEVHRLQREVQDLKDVHLNCACFGLDDQQEVP